MNIQDMIKRGYFPTEIPPEFSPSDFSAAIPSLTATDPGKWTRPVEMNLARPGTLRRRLAIPNPFSQLRLVRECAASWATLDAHVKTSRISLSRPVINTSATGRALRFSTPFGARATERVLRMGRARYTLRTDINDFYGSLYTHSLEWALHTKAHAKANLSARGPRLLGGKIDNAVRNGQDGQTKGIPVGPDTSLLLAEIVLTAIDEDLVSAFPNTANWSIRLLDDLEFFAETRGEAEDVLMKWDSLLHGYDLTLNPRKTQIIEGPVPSEASWKVSLSQFNLRRDTDAKLANDLQSFFSRAFELSREYPDEAVLTYAIGSVHPRPVTEKSWKIFQHLLMASVTAEPSSIRHVSYVFKNAATIGLPMQSGIIADTLNGICYHHAPLEHGSEVAWSLHILRTLGLPLSSQAASRIARMQDNASLLLLQEFVQRNAITGTVPDLSDVLTRAEDPDAWQSEDWLLGYEFARNGWSNPTGFQAQPHWKELLTLGIAFFHTATPPSTTTATPSTSTPATPPTPATTPPSTPVTPPPSTPATPTTPPPATTTSPTPATPVTPPSSPATGEIGGSQHVVISPVVEDSESPPESSY